MANTKLIPLASQPAYQEAVGKVAHISAALTRTTEELDRLHTNLRELQSLNSEQEGSRSSMDRALAIADGSAESAALIPIGLQAEIDRLTQKRKALQDGLAEANRSADAVAEQLSREVGAQAKAAHRATVKRVLECMELLCEANEAEQKVRTDLEKLGYHRHGLQGKGFAAVGRIDDWTGSPAFYFNREAKAYLGDK